MRTPRLNAEQTVYRSRRTYRSAAAGTGPAGEPVVMADLAGWCCADDGAHCVYCPHACYVTSSGPHCLSPHAAEERPTFRLASTGWPYHCLSGDHHHEVYCQHGCAADDTHAFCILTHATAEAPTEATFLKA